MKIMMAARIYGLMWLVAAMVGFGLYFTGSFTTTTSIIYGFLVSVLAGAALLVVFPTMMSERVQSRASASSGGDLRK